MTMRYRRHPDLRVTSVDGEGIVLHLETRTYFTVNETGLAILEALAEPRTREELAGVLLDRYDVSPAQAATSVAAFVRHGLDARLLEEVRPA